MKLVINTRNMKVKGYVKRDVEEHFEKLEKYFSDEASAVVTFSGEGVSKKVEITVHMKNNVLRSEVSDMDVRVALDKAIERIERQLIKYKDKLKKHNKESIRFENIKDEPEEDLKGIVKNKKFVLKPMSIEEACLQLELLEHDFFVFLNEQTSRIAIVYRRKAKDYGLIEPEI